MSIGGWLERVVGGDSRIHRDQMRLGDYGIGQAGLGAGIGARGLAGVEGGLADYEAMARSGRVLPESVYRGFAQAKGGVTDEAGRSMRAVRASIAARRAATGGLMSAESGEEFARMGEADVQANTFDALRDVDLAQSQAELEGTRDLWNRIDAGRSQIMNYGQWLQQLGVSTWSDSLTKRHERLNAMAQSMSPY